MAKNNYGKNVTLATTTISWSHLHKPDTKFGNPGNYNVSIEVTPEIEQQLKDAISASGFGKVNGINGITKDKTVREDAPEAAGADEAAGVSEDTAAETADAALEDEIPF